MTLYMTEKQKNAIMTEKQKKRHYDWKKDIMTEKMTLWLKSKKKWHYI